MNTEELVQVDPSVLVIIVLLSPTTTHSLSSLLYVMPFKFSVETDFYVVQVYQSLDVLITPLLPTAINNEFANNTSFKS